MKALLPLVMIGALGIAGCANTSPYSGDVYRSGQAETAQSVTYGTITSVRQVQIQAGEQNESILGGLGGAVLGGLLGNQVGGGSGRTIATAAGAIGGSVAGSKVENAANRTNAWEIEIRRDSGDSIVVVQKADRDWQVGQRVRMIGSGANLSVAPY
ncbi:MULTISPECIES: outer membrane lipoprotein [Chromohalobacter]|uniref:17 kDa surface antigen n=1 Tax=Chromohalobacter israelensis (strain ATCC BAA-138 / DSM 3043 / CIP 106854 / NCIMB 13768 / 1H11) TaxID=290398 RepID=Q1QY03_CHRI1|nr:glycine zipper 2TM domain-containing protein [Chromohalobacter salexigens]ABE58655.1 17 kDa surface antigen [Chromohalobacter salexigens DSM 3043]MBZ5875304.1 glycine zipper 2TM domain-containing protein [Chromohalobacter salexigens]MDO0944776.1 glycine zipper 2TM domain-containing protein [Chromohalobacter salexigens]NWO54881.1 glycine zipper 2TM domain-containing protein [Chromohalobacter salexigens]PWW41232.1 outer membrane lipoprotein SlyB [Chromohalobacter salexigens]